jgi:pilus assembly protein Flp/PilA
MKKLVARVRRLGRRRDEGATAVEYGLLVALIAIVLAAGAWFLGDTLNTNLNETADCVTNGAGYGGACP